MIEYEQLNRSVQGVLATPLDMLATCMRGNEMVIIQPSLFDYDSQRKRIPERLKYNAVGGRLCTHCEAYKPVAAFGHKDGSSRRLASWCKDCKADYQTTAVVKERATIRHRRTTYGLTGEAFDALVEAHQGVCAICFNPPTSGKGWHVDHDHETGVIRGLLCHECNTGLGKFKDDPQLMETAIAYLRRYGK